LDITLEFFSSPTTITLILAPLNGFDPRPIAGVRDNDILGWEREPSCLL